MITTTQQLQSYLHAFDQSQKRAPAHDQAWLRGVREDAFARFCQLDFPTVHEEDWRFTNVASIAQTAFQLPQSAAEGVTEHQLSPYRLVGLAGQLVFVNGRYAPELSRLPLRHKGLKVTSLAEAILKEREKVEPHFARYADYRQEAFTALNTAFFEDGAFVFIPRGMVLQEPIYLLYLNVGSETPLMAHPRNLIVAEEDSQATVVEDYVSLRPGLSLDRKSVV